MSALTDMVTKVRDGARRALARPLAYLTAEWERLAPRQRRLLVVVRRHEPGPAHGRSARTGCSAASPSSRTTTRPSARRSRRSRSTATSTSRRSRAAPRRRRASAPTRPSSRATSRRPRTTRASRSPNRASGRRRPPAGATSSTTSTSRSARSACSRSREFLRRLETGPRLVVFTRLSLKRRFSDAEKLDVEATATAFERVREEKVTKKKPGAGDTGKKE